MATGYEQVRSITAYIAGKLKASQCVELVLPDTGVCSSSLSNQPTNQILVVNYSTVSES